MNKPRLIAWTLAGIVAAALTGLWLVRSGSKPAATEAAEATAPIAGELAGKTMTAEATSDTLLVDAGKTAMAEKPRSPYIGTQLRDAQALIDAGQIDEAIAMLTYQVSAFTKPLKIARAQVLLARLLVGRGYLDEALALFKLAVASGALPPTEWFEAYLDVVRTYTKLGMMDEALAWVQQADAEFLASGKDRAWFDPEEARLTLSRTLYNLGYYDIALEHAARISGSGSSKARQASLIEARALRALGRDEEARAALEKGIGENGGEGYTDVSKLYHELVKMVMQGGDTEEALALAARGAKAFEGSARYEDYMYFMGTLLRQHGISEWERYAVAAATGDDARRRVLALEQLAASAARSGRWQDAARYYQEMINLPGRTGIEVAGDYLRLMDTQVKQGQSAQPVVDSLMAFLEVTEIADTATLHRIGKGLLGAGYYAEAEAYFLRVVEGSTRPDEVERAYLLLGDTRAAAGDMTAANAAYGEVIRRMSENGQYDMVAQTLYRQAEKTGRLQFPDEKDELIGRIEEQARQITDADSLLDLLDYFAARDESALPETLLAVASDLVMNGEPNEDGWETKGRLLAGLYAYGPREHASALIAAILDDSRGSPVPGNVIEKALFYDALLTLKGNDRAAFYEKAERLVDLPSMIDVHVAEYARGFGEELYFVGDSARALEYFERAVRAAPGSTDAMQSRLYLGVEALKRGELELARQYTDSIVAGMSPSAPISLHRAIYWGGVYLQGLLLNAAGLSGGDRLVNEAKAKNGNMWAPMLTYNTAVE